MKRLLWRFGHTYRIKSGQKHHKIQTEMKTQWRRPIHPSWLGYNFFFIYAYHPQFLFSNHLFPSSLTTYNHLIHGRLFLSSNPPFATCLNHLYCYLSFCHTSYGWIFILFLYLFFFLLKYTNIREWCRTVEEYKFVQHYKAKSKFN